MSLILTDDEQALRDSVRRFVADRTPLTAVRQLIASGEPYDAGIWKQLSAQLGWPGWPSRRSTAASGAGHAAMAVALQELGAGLVPSPLLASGVLAAGVLLRARRHGGPRGAAAGHRQRRGRGHAGAHRAGGGAAARRARGRGRRARPGCPARWPRC